MKDAYCKLMYQSVRRIKKQKRNVCNKTKQSDEKRIQKMYFTWIRYILSFLQVVKNYFLLLIAYPIMRLFRLRSYKNAFTPSHTKAVVNLPKNAQLEKGFFDFYGKTDHYAPLPHWTIGSVDRLVLFFNVYSYHHFSFEIWRQCYGTNLFLKRPSKMKIPMRYVT